MEASGEPFGFFAHDCQKEFPSFFWLFCAQVLNVDLCRFVTKLDFHFGAARAHPKEHLITRVKDHDIIMSKVILQNSELFSHSPTILSSSVLSAQKC